jgi:hypothetical protein
MELQSELARAQGEVAAQQRQVDAAAVQRQELQAALNAAQELHPGARTATRDGKGHEERHAGEMKRVLLDVDRERGNAGKLQKEVEQMRRETASQPKRIVGKCWIASSSSTRCASAMASWRGVRPSCWSSGTCRPASWRQCANGWRQQSPGVLQAPEPRSAARRSPRLRNPRPDLEPPTARRGRRPAPLQGQSRR